MKKTTILRRLLDGPKIIQAPGAHEPIVAKIIENAGFEAVYMSGGCTSAAVYGMPDVGLVSFTENVTNAKNIANKVNLPLIADADTGYGNAINVMRTVREYILAGTAALHLEDQVFPKRCGWLAGKVVVPMDEYIGKFKAAVRVRDEIDPEYVLIARTDARNAVGGSLEKTIKRAKEYVKAKADVVFADGLRSADEARHFIKEVDAPGLIVSGGIHADLSLTELQDMGYKIVIYPGSALMLQIKVTRDLMETIKKEGTDKKFKENMVTLREMWDLVGLNTIQEHEKEFLPAEEVDRRYKESEGL